MMAVRGVFALLVSCAAVGAQANLLPPAVGLLGIPNGGAGTRFGQSMVGAGFHCAGVHRSLAALNPKLTAGEPLLLRLLLRPDQESEIQRFSAQLVHGADLKVMVYPPKPLQPYLYTGAQLGTSNPSVTLDLTGTNGMRFDLRMAMDENNASGAAFDIPGRYQLKAFLRCVEDQELDQEELEIGAFEVIVAPAAGEDQLAMQWLADHYEAFRALQENTAVTTAGDPLISVEALAVFSRIHRELRHAALRPHAMVILADKARHDKRLPEAIGILSELQKDYPGTPFEQQALLVLNRIAREGPDEALIRQRFLELWEHPSLTYVLHPKATLFEKFVGPFRPEIGTQWMLFERPGPDPTGTGTASGLRIQLSDEVQQQLGLPEFVTPETLSNTPLSPAMIRRAPQ